MIKPYLFLSDSKMECLQLTITEVLKRLNSKSKKGYNQVRKTWLHSVGVVCGCWAREQKRFDLNKTFSNSKTSATKTLPRLRLQLIYLFLPRFCSSWALLKLKSTRCKSVELKTRLLPSVWTRMRKKYCRASPGKLRFLHPCVSSENSLGCKTHFTYSSSHWNERKNTQTFNS